MLNEKFVHESPAVRQIHRRVPERGDQQTQKRSPEQTKDKSLTRKFKRKQIKKRDNSKWKNDSDQAFCKQRQTYEKVKSEK